MCRTRPARPWRYVEFFTANINNPHTRRAYARACARFFAWCEQRGLTLAAIRPFDVAAWVNELQETHGAPGVKQQLAAVRMLFDWLITGQVVPFNPASAVRGPKHVVKTGKTPVLDGAEWRRLIDSIPTDTVRELRDRALIATLTYSFARITAALRMKVEDLRPQGAGWQVQLHEKGGKQHAMPCHHALAEALRAYIDAAGIAEDRKGFLFRTSPGHNATVLTEQPMVQADASGDRHTAYPRRRARAPPATARSRGSARHVRSQPSTHAATARIPCRSSAGVGVTCIQRAYRRRNVVHAMAADRTRGAARSGKRDNQRDNERHQLANHGDLHRSHHSLPPGCASISRPSAFSASGNFVWGLEAQ